MKYNTLESKQALAYLKTFLSMYKDLEDTNQVNTFECTAGHNMRLEGLDVN